MVLVGVFSICFVCFLFMGILYSFVMVVVGNKVFCDGFWMDVEKRIYFLFGVKVEGSLDEEWVVSFCVVFFVVGIIKILKLLLWLLVKVICLLLGD